MHIWTETPGREIWQQLRYLKSPANLVNLLSGRTISSRSVTWPDDAAPHERAYEISCCIEQADQYFRAAQDVDLATKPLLQFYGSQALAKAAVLANDQRVRLRDLSYHGLSSRASTAKGTEKDSLQKYANNPATWAVEQEFAVTNEGVFPHLVQVAEGFMPKNYQPLHLKELLRITPDLATLYVRHYGESSHAFYLYDGPKLEEDGHFVIFFRRTDKDRVKKVFPEFTHDYEETERHNQPGFRSRVKMSQKPTFGVEVRGAVAGNYFVCPHPSGFVKPLSVLYAAQFILSNVVRYKPVFWMRVLEGRTTGAAAIIEALCALVDRRFPCEVLGSIWNERFTFGSPGYVS
jgi:hypothetical protein